MPHEYPSLCGVVHEFHTMDFPVKPRPDLWRELFSPDTAVAVTHTMAAPKHDNLTSILPLGRHPAMVFGSVPLPLLLHELAELPFLLESFVPEI